MRLPTILCVAGLAAGCGDWGFELEPATYTVRGQVQPEFAGDPLPAPSALHVQVVDGWEDDADPFPVDAPLLGEAGVGADGRYELTVEEGDHVGKIAIVIVDDAPGAPDLLVATINDRHVDGNGVADVDTFAITRARLDGWAASPALAGRDPEAEGAALLTFLDRDRRPAAGVDARAAALAMTSRGAEVFYLDDDGVSIVDGATATTASGRVLVFGASGFDASGTDDPALDDLTHDHVGCGMRPGAIFVETVSQLELTTYDVQGRVAPLYPGDAQGPLDVRVLDVWERAAAPVAEDVPVLASVTPDDTGAFTATVTEDADGAVAAVSTDDAAGAPDLLVPTISSASASAPPRLDVVTISHERVAGWQASPRLADHDLVAEGAALLTFVDAQGRPEAGVTPRAFTGAPIFILSRDGASIDPVATTTTSSGRAIVVGQPILAGGTRGPEETPSHQFYWVGTRPGAITSVTLGPEVAP